MATIHIRHHHDLTPAETRQRMERMVKRFEGRYTGVYSWHRNSLRFHRTGASGIIAWGDGYIELYIKLGLLLVPKRNQIEALIRQHLPTALREFAG